MTVKIASAPRTRGYHTWTDAEIAAYEARWPLGTRQRLWLAVLQHTGLRRGDATRLRWDDIRDGIIRVHARKNGAPVAVPLEPELAEALAAGPRFGRIVCPAGKVTRDDGVAMFVAWAKAHPDEASTMNPAEALVKAAVEKWGRCQQKS